jgi:hypothetical protein
MERLKRETVQTRQASTYYRQNAHAIEALVKPEREVAASAFACSSPAGKLT